MKTSELIAHLQASLQEHGDLDVNCSGEGVITGIDAIYRQRNLGGDPIGLILDWNGAWYLPEDMVHGDTPIYLSSDEDVQENASRTRV